MSIITTSATPLQPDFAALPLAIRQRLHGANVHTFSQWLSLGAKRNSIFGITTRMAAELDRLARVRS